MKKPQPYLGIIEGFYGTPWTTESRLAQAKFLHSRGYSFYVYAPKADRYLRRMWRETWPEDMATALSLTARTFHQHGVDFGVGLSPFELYLNYSSEGKRALQRKIQEIEQLLQPKILCLLFDDMRGGIGDLAHLQSKICQDVLDCIDVERVILCPTYYSLDPYLERTYGAKPDDYLGLLGKELPKQVDVFWTGPTTFSTCYPTDHMTWVAECLGRKPFLWDNYPVNDAENVWHKLFIKPFSNRGAELAELTVGHAVNPMKQAWLSQLPLASLPMSYEQASEYDPDSAFPILAEELWGKSFSNLLTEHITLFQDRGLLELSTGQIEEFRRRYAEFLDIPAACEIINWLSGSNRFDPRWLEE